MGLISKHKRKNTIILAFVISVCLTLTLYSLGVIDLLKKICNAVPSLPSSSPEKSPVEGIKQTSGSAGFDDKESAKIVE